MQLNNELKQLEELQIKMHAYEHAMSILYVDSVTVAPSDTAYGRGVTMGILAEESHNIFANEKVGALLKTLKENDQQLDATAKKQVELLDEDYQKTIKIPVEEIVEYSKLVNEATSVWHTAKEADDYDSFEPLLNKIIEYNKRLAVYYDDKKLPYDALLNEYEKGITMDELDVFFKNVGDKISPLVKETAGSKVKINDEFLKKSYPVEKQKILSDYIMQVMNIDRTHCSIGETEHPFTSTMNKNDVRITTNYHENQLISSLYSVIHESGHALYELNIDDNIAYSCAAGGTSMGIHESQSRFYENIVGRSKEFISFIYPKIAELFPAQLSGVTENDLYLAVNKSKPDLIRIEADELTYPLHIMVRYEIEKLLISGDLTTKELPLYWNKMYKEYLGVDVPDNRAGLLQDSHWSQGAFGYFPSYALGSAYSAQMLDSMLNDVNVWADLRKGELKNIISWLTDKIYRYGKLLDPAEVIMNCCAKPFDPAYYTDYLTNKFTDIYKL